MTAKALLDRNPNPTDAEIREGMEGVLCRCMTYYRIQAAIKRVARGTTAAAHGGDADADAPAMSATVAAIARETTE
jgi:xanthine dehydrogenase iron-sulfur cluster and FAD-binding subunit A